jgi:hypothetical protein
VSRAFIKETDETFETLPDRPISPHPNFVTSIGLECRVDDKPSFSSLPRHLVKTAQCRECRTAAPSVSPK